jgi:hypothetical protein
MKDPLSLRNDPLKLEIVGELPIVLEESIEEYNVHSQLGYYFWDKGLINHNDFQSKLNF